MVMETETTPLLSNHLVDSPSSPQQDEEGFTSVLGISWTWPRALFIFSWFAVILSALTSFYNVSAGLMVKGSEYERRLTWEMRECIDSMLGLSFLSAFGCAFNYYTRLYKETHGIWLLLSLILDALVGFYCLNISIMGLEALQYGSGCNYNLGDCEAFAKKVAILSRIGLGLGIVIGFIQLVFFLRSCVLVYREWKQGMSAWRLPTGQFTIEFTIKISRQEEMGAQSA